MPSPLSEFSYTQPKRLPKKRKIPTTAEFRKAAAELDYINSLCTEFKIPAIVDLLSDSETEPEMHDYESTHHNQARRRQAKDLDGKTTQPKRGKALRKSNVPKRRLIVDSEDESHDDSLPHSPSPSASIPSKSLRECRQNRRRRRSEEWILSDTDEEIVRKPKRRKLDLKAEDEDLDIDMKGWEDVVKRDGSGRRGR
ncbi:hypothetical protein Ptr902_07422 [Pyrenophora tritici-repentis]|nr:hypothetical protein Ptr902_07422 [Pyrenophora tritici-repentis]